MPIVMVSKAYHFIKHNIVKDEKTGELTASKEFEIVVNPHTYWQDLPAWVEDDELFQIAVEEGSINYYAPDPNAEKRADAKKKRESRQKLPNLGSIPEAKPAFPEQLNAGGKFDPGATPLKDAGVAGRNWPGQKNEGLQG